MHLEGSLPTAVVVLKLCLYAKAQLLVQLHSCFVGGCDMQ